MKKHVFLISFIGFCMMGFSQEEATKKTNPFSSGDRLIFDMYTDVWQNIPDLVSAKSINTGIAISSMYDIPFGRSGAGLGIGVGYSAHNFYSNAMPVRELNFITGEETDKMILEPLGDIAGKAVDYEKNKFSVGYIDIPLEFRYKYITKESKKFRITAGFKMSFLIDAHTKYKGDDLTGLDRKVKVKEKDIKNVESYQYGIIARAGYEWINFYLYYPLTTIFKEEKGPAIYPISIGISIIPF